MHSGSEEVVSMPVTLPMKFMVKSALGAAALVPAAQTRFELFRVCTRVFPVILQDLFHAAAWPPSHTRDAVGHTQVAAALSPTTQTHFWGS